VSELSEKFCDLDGRDLAGVTAYAIEVIRAGEWNLEIGHMLGRMVGSFHPDKFAEFAERIERELERRPRI
jgi:hypothetical protein